MGRCIKDGVVMTAKKLLKQAKCKMEVICNKDWTQLAETEQEGIRFCGDCKKLVFYTQTASELRLAAEKGLCVFIVPKSTAAEASDLAKKESIESKERIRQIEMKALARMKRGLTGSAKLNW